LSRASLSVCIIVKDEQALLPGAIWSVAVIADEIIVGVDTRTTDRTMQIAKDRGCRVHTFKWEDSFSAARNIGLGKARKDWIMVIDADDRVTEWGQQTIREVLRRPRVDVEAYGVQIENRALDGSRLSVDPLPSVRLWPNHQGIHYVNRVHEVPRGKHGDLSIGWLRGGIGLTHLGYDPVLYEMRAKDERNLALLTRQLEERPGDRLLTYELARQHVIGKRYTQAAEAAKRALSMPGNLRPELIQELERIQ
jgi:glycosyltransferase involved in cell wall biosynthesis